MRKTKYTVKYTTGFKKDYKRAIKRGLKIELLEQVVALLAMGEPLPEKNRRTGFPIRRQMVYLPNKSLCDPVRASVRTSTSSSIR